MSTLGSMTEGCDTEAWRWILAAIGSGAFDPG
jgi:hypothetical protein